MHANKSNIDQSSTAKTNRRSFLKSAAAAAGTALLGTGLAQAQSKQKEVQLLFVQTSHDVAMGKDRLTLIGVSPTTLFFSDRPKRIAGHMTTEDFKRKLTVISSAESCTQFVSIISVRLSYYLVVRYFELTSERSTLIT